MHVFGCCLPDMCLTSGSLLRWDGWWRWYVVLVCFLKTENHTRCK